jgi:outer membrane murein-binding lipoprotein Lpp
MALQTVHLGAWVVVLLLGAGGTEGAGGSKLKQRADTLASQARALANPRGCEKVEECELAGFGHRPCGGPREYLAYCSRTTDVKTLRARLEALEKAEKAWQQEAGLKSTCGLTRKPRLQWEQGECRAR